MLQKDLSLLITSLALFKQMEKFKKTQIVKLLLVAALLVIIAPLSSTAFMRSANLYFVVNIIIIAVAAEAGLLSFFLISAENEKPAAVSVASQKPMIISGVFPYCKERMDGTNMPHQSAMITQAVEKCSSEAVEVHKAPSIFFIGGGESDTDQAKFVEDDGEEEEVGEMISGQELFQKAEIFIGNFYKQLNIQREESWKKLQKAL